ncbi:ATP synthase F0 subunit B [Cereibacter changlensis]|uniref:ATP synthase subunit b n=1 Tax=Cereibacter changlensis TaxID=402884 RepID=A0A2W7QK77_9RHOB|nr:ATP synthase F0 subunit B [Cereibacter changlensis]PZX48773.1 F-type H+-transporting ATPase subunit b [Cereibacter changlensis]
MSFDLWTLGFQAINVLLLVWLLHRFFWKPVAATIAARQADVATLLQGAEAKRSEAEGALAEIEAIRAGLAAERDALLAETRKEAEAARSAVMASARAEAETLKSAARVDRMQAAEALKASARQDAERLALVIAGQLVARLDAASTDAAFLGWLAEGLTGLSDADRRSLAGATPEIVSATPKDGAAQEGIAKIVATALGQPVTLTFRADPALIAGYELHSPHVTLRNSWAADLARIAASLAASDAAVSDAA